VKRFVLIVLSVLAAIGLYAVAAFMEWMLDSSSKGGAS